MNRKYKHITPRYIVNRLYGRFWELNNTGYPWLNRHACRFLDNWLDGRGVGLEWGSGRSTNYFSKVLQKITSVEHDPVWYELVRKQLKASNSGCELLLKDPNDTSDYVDDVCNRFEDGSLDFVMIDGVLRDQCALAILPKLKTGGLLIIDDSHRYIPSKSVSPYAVKPNDNPESPVWGEFLQKVTEWKSVQFSDGVHDSRFYFVGSMIK